MKIAISVESTVDLSKELLKQYNLEMIPFTVLLGETSYLDGDITSQDIFDFVAKEKILPKTSAINDFQYREYFDGLLAKGYDAIIHISLSSEISSSFSHGELASTKYDNVYMIDSRSLSTGIALLAIYACKLRDKGLRPQEIVDKVKARIPYVQASFVIQTLEYLHKGGRYEHRVVLPAAGQNMHKSVYLGLTADYRIQLSRRCHEHQVSGKAVQHGSFAFHRFLNQSKPPLYPAFSAGLPHAGYQHQYHPYRKDLPWRRPAHGISASL